MARISLMTDIPHPECLDDEVYLTNVADDGRHVDAGLLKEIFSYKTHRIGEVPLRYTDGQPWASVKGFPVFVKKTEFYKINPPKPKFIVGQLVRVRDTKQYSYGHVLRITCISGQRIEFGNKTHERESAYRYTLDNDILLFESQIEAIC